MRLAAAPGPPGSDLDTRAERGDELCESLGAAPGREERRAKPLPGNGRHDGDVGERGSGCLDRLGEIALQPDARRVQIGEDDPGSENRCRFRDDGMRTGRGHEADDEVGSADGVGDSLGYCAGRGPAARVDVPRADGTARLGQVGRDRCPGLAEADDGDGDGPRGPSPVRRSEVSVAIRPWDDNAWASIACNETITDRH